MRSASNHESSLGTIRLLSAYLRPYRMSVGLKLFSTLLSASNDIFMVYVISALVNASLSGDRAELTNVVYLMAISVVAGVVASVLGVYTSGRYSTYAVRDMKNAVGERLGKLPVSYIDSRHSGDFSSRMTTSMNAIEGFLNHDLAAVLFHIVRVVVCIAFMFYMNWQLTLFCFLIILIMAVVTVAISRPLGEYAANVHKGMANTNSMVQDTISGFYLVKSYNLAQVFVEKYRGTLHQVLEHVLRIAKRIAAMESVSILVRTVPFIVFFLFGGYLVHQDLLTIGALLAFAQFINYLTTGMGELPRLLSNYKTTSGVVNYVFEFYDEQPERDGGKTLTARDCAHADPVLAFNGVSASYDESTKVLDDISFTLPKGKTVAIVGPSGSGKTTIFKLIVGFYPYQSGEIKLFNEPLSSVSLSSARSMLSMVSQDTFLYPGTIEENITCLNDGYSREDVELAAKTANIHAYIQSLPDGYQTIVGERGVKLSGGQRQRIAIARAILKNAPILLLDEATSALDTESEYLVQAAINRIMADKTVLLIAHRLSTVMTADHIIVLDEGRIVQQGTHAELLAVNGMYNRLFRNQSANWDAMTQQSDREGA